MGKKVRGRLRREEAPRTQARRTLSLWFAVHPSSPSLRGLILLVNHRHMDHPTRPPNHIPAAVPADALCPGGLADVEGGLGWETELEAWQGTDCRCDGSSTSVCTSATGVWSQPCPQTLPTTSGHHFPPLLHFMVLRFSAWVGGTRETGRLGLNSLVQVHPF